MDKAETLATILKNKPTTLEANQKGVDKTVSHLDSRIKELITRQVIPDKTLIAINTIMTDTKGLDTS